jgi:hypothetical protein
VCLWRWGLINWKDDALLIEYFFLVCCQVKVAALLLTNSVVAFRLPCIFLVLFTEYCFMSCCFSRAKAAVNCLKLMSVLKAHGSLHYSIYLRHLLFCMHKTTASFNSVSCVHMEVSQCQTWILLIHLACSGIYLLIYWLLLLAFEHFTYCALAGGCLVILWFWLTFMEILDSI